MDIEIYKFDLKDLESIKDFLTLDFDDFWNYNVLKDELVNENSRYIVAKNVHSINEIVGFAGIKLFLDDADIMNIVVKKNYRNNGVGTLLLENLISLCNELNLQSLSLEVNEENLPAINLYKKFVFKDIGTRKNYYKDKNGIIMKKVLV